MLRLYEYNRTTNKVLNYWQFQFNVTKANIEKQSDWHLGYNMKEEYKMNGFEAKDFLDLSQRLVTDDVLWNKYLFNYHGGKDGSNLDRDDAICKTMTATGEQHSACMETLFGRTEKGGYGRDTDPYTSQKD